MIVSGPPAAAGGPVPPTSSAMSTKVCLVGPHRTGIRCLSGRGDAGELPGAIEDFRPGLIEPNCIVPTVRDRDRVGRIRAMVTESDGDRSVWVTDAGDA